MKDINDPKVKLFLQQKQLLDTFLEHKAISQAQYDVSYNGLIQKMGFSEEEIKLICHGDGSPGKISSPFPKI